MNRFSAWSEDFHDVPWIEVARLYRRLSERHPQSQHLTDIVDSVVRSGRDQDLAASMSMHDLIVTTRPVPEAPIEEVVVRAPGSVIPVANGTVVVERFSDVHPGQITGPVDEAVPLFWQSVATVFGIMPPSTD
ncbi:hypothetical protein [Nocardia asteroides]|uniref:hypothetical protein n=1 Tax=Nocardia asteroides TaxID=1824 RepID=UPI001E5CA086|nr:hypothetical protein [Nocardia asteroides]UGT60538.1 hypothetical protein LTT61_25690 [Nocardia asteroides]